MALNAEKDILEEYSKRNLCSHYRRVIHVITLFFYDKYDGNNFILIWHNQDGLECREGRPGGVQQDKLVPQYGGMGARFARGFAHPLPNHSLTGYGGLLR